MIRGLSAEFHLAETFMSVSCSFPNRFRKEFLGHKMGTGAGGKVAAVLDELHAAQVNLAVALDGVFNGVFGFCERRGIENDDVELLALVFERG